MPEYSYRAVDSNGIFVRARVQEKSKQSLIKKLKNNGFTPIYVNQTSFGKYGKNRQKVNQARSEEVMRLATDSVQRDARNNAARQFSLSERIKMNLSQQTRIETRDIVIFTQNFYLLKKAGFNNLHALSTLVQATENLTLRGILEDVLAGVEGGDYMYSTLEYYSDIFPYIYINLIKVGELSGNLEESLRQAVAYLESADTLTKKIKGILIPSIAQFFGMFAVLIAGTMYLVPTIQNVYKSVGSTDSLPAITLWFSDFLNTMLEMWYIPLAVIVAIAMGFYAWIKTPKGRYSWDQFKYRAPLFGKLMFSIDFSRMSKAMLLNLRNGMRIQDALETSKNITKNYVMLSIIEASINNIIVGKSWVEPFEDSGLPSPMITEMLKIGMQTDLADMMDKLVEYMEQDVDVIISKIVKVLPQITYGILGIMLIFITIVVLVPALQGYMGDFLFSAAGL